MEEGTQNVISDTSVQFFEDGADLTSIEVGRKGRVPIISRLHRALFTLGIVISAYQVRTLPNGVVERIVLQRRDGGAIRGELSHLTRAAILPIALESDT